MHVPRFMHPAENHSSDGILETINHQFPKKKGMKYSRSTELTKSKVSSQDKNKGMIAEQIARIN